MRGAVTVGLGENRDLGGANATGFGYAAALLGATLEVDGKKRVAGGKLMISPAQMQRTLKPLRRDGAESAASTVSFREAQKAQLSTPML